jgi:hypothetical protein
MGLTVTEKGRFSKGNTYDEVYLDVTFDSSYPSGGEVLDIPSSDEPPLSVRGGLTNGGYYCAPVKQADGTYKLKLFYGDNNNASDGPLIENATADMSAESVEVVAVVSN